VMVKIYFTSLFPGRDRTNVVIRGLKKDVVKALFATGAVFFGLS
jgi:hypothetical protein